MRTERRHIRVTGTVQGVGFRPFVYRHAVGLGLTGWVRNDGAGVEVEAEGPPAKLDDLCDRLRHSAPPLARVASVSASVIPAGEGPPRFAILASDRSGGHAAPVSVDVATCEACLAEVDDPGNRRYRYPFTNCTDCGPRYTIVTSVPYDRSATTMAGFAMCPACRAEYDDPADRRFHAEPNACPVCGPRLRWLDGGGLPSGDGDAALDAAVSTLLEGGVVAVKGLGGFHLAADATDGAAVASLRARKARDDKPFAVMVPDLATARSLADVGRAAEAALLSPRRPIVIAPRRPGGPIVDAVAPGLPDVGLLLPYTALHHLLLAGVGRPLVMTSGNLTDEPIAFRDDDAVARLGPLVDGILSSDRPIHIRCDDSVARPGDGRLRLLRRARGYAPQPLRLPYPALRPVLAVGAELKNTVAVTRGDAVIASHHLGDLEHLATYRSFVQAIDHLCGPWSVAPEQVAHDLHPEYLSTKWAADHGLESVPVQHHHAHIASCLVEHGETGPVLGLAFDGLGYGSDGSLWGGEFVIADLVGFSRVGHLAAVPLPGGAAAIREPWRMALAWAHVAGGDSLAGRVGPGLDERWRVLLPLIGAAPTTTSVGRLFDAVAALLHVRHSIRYEGQAAIELEALARPVRRGGGRRYSVEACAGDGSGFLLNPAPLIGEVIRDVAAGVDPSLIAAGFHDSLAAAVAGLAAQLAAAHALDTVVLSGGVFQNVRFSDAVEGALSAAGLRVLTHAEVPPNDGGISIGQAAVAAARQHAGVTKR